LKGLGADLLRKLPTGEKTVKNLKTKAAAGTTIVLLGGLGGLALSQGNKAPSKSVADKPVVHTKVIRRTIHVTKHAKPKHPPAAAPVEPASAGTSSAGAPAVTGSSGATATEATPVTTSSSSTGTSTEAAPVTTASSSGGSSESAPVTTTASGGGGGGEVEHGDGGGGHDD
jgi:hypothetical protein